MNRMFQTILGKACKRILYPSLFTAASSSTITYTFDEDDENKDSPRTMKFYRENELTHQFLIKQSTILSSEAASKLLTHTIIALDDAVTRYKTSNSELANMYENDSILLEDHGERVVQLETELSELKDFINDTELLFIYVKNLCNANAQVTFITNSELASIQISERLFVAENQFKELMSKARLSELDLVKEQSRHIDRIGKKIERY